ncbi:MAG: alpha-glucosidase [Bacteroidales bacterium]|nr:alpha-glucosidase [Bacteroidales bacterium]
MSEEWIWWKHGIIYHIYPLSFYDSNGDGIGDIPGVIEKLPYLKELGVDAIWFSPLYESPFADGGYDISNFRNIDTRFGSIDDFRKLTEYAHTLGIRVIMDLVMNHTSIQHDWFIESNSSTENDKSDWYIWHPGKNGKKPNNWKSAIGGSAWTYSSERKQYYYHSFFHYQPDLNWRNKQMREEYFKQVIYWLDLGVDGFRLDVVNLIVKDKKFRNAPLLSSFPFLSTKSYTRNRPKSFKVLKQLRKIVDGYQDRLLLGEIYAPPPGDSTVAARYLGSDTPLLNLAFDFSLIYRLWNPKSYMRVIIRALELIPEGGWPCNVFSNHDLLRYLNRPGFYWFREEKAKLIATLLLTLKGTPVLYYGDEIGMRNTSLRFSELQDPTGKKYWPFYKGRDRARTPMQWNRDLHAGFSKVKPWIPLNPDYLQRNIESQSESEKSLLTFYRKLIKVRKEYLPLQMGNWIPQIEGENGIMAYSRVYENECLLIVLNFRNYYKSPVFSEDAQVKVLISTHRNTEETTHLNILRLFPFEGTIFQVID